VQNISPSDYDEPFAAIIRCTADPEKVDKRTRSKWSRVLRYAMEYKPLVSRLVRLFSARAGSMRVLGGSSGVGGEDICEEGGAELDPSRKAVGRGHTLVRFRGCPKS
jgi:hypothetical protein